MLIGLTGGIASGKSTVSDLLRGLGAHVICADDLARRVVEPGSPALAEIVACFGEQYLDEAGRLDRARMGERVFSDPEARKQLEGILHPRIREAFLAEVARIRAREPDALIVYDVPLLIEAGAHREVDRVIVVAVDRDTQVARLIRRDGLSREQAERRIDAQITLEQRLRHADEVIDGAEAPERIRARLKRILDTWRRNQG